jgi:hypothetical protein
MPEQVVPLSELERDLPAPPAGWAAELDRRGVAVVADDLGRAAVDRATARALFSEHHEQQVAAARKREEAERQAIEADQAFRAQLPKGIPVDAIPAGMTAGQLMMAVDRMAEGSKRQTVVEHALQNPDGAIVYHSIGGES